MLGIFEIALDVLVHEEEAQEARGCDTPRSRTMALRSRRRSMIASSHGMRTISLARCSIKIQMSAMVPHRAGATGPFASVPSASMRGGRDEPSASRAAAEILGARSQIKRAERRGHEERERRIERREAREAEKQRAQRECNRGEDCHRFAEHHFGDGGGEYNLGDAEECGRQAGSRIR